MSPPATSSSTRRTNGVGVERKKKRVSAVPRRMTLFLSPTPSLELLRDEGMKATILDAARRCMLQFGSSKLSMVDVARVAGVSRGSVYKYFPEREELIDAVGQVAFGAFEQDLQEAVSSLDRLDEQLLAATIVLREWDQGIREVTGGEILGEEEFNQFVTGRADLVISRIMQVMRPYLERDRERGELRDGVDLSQCAEWIARALYSLSVIPTITFDADNADSLAEAFVSFLLHGIAI